MAKKKSPTRKKIPRSKKTQSIIEELVSSSLTDRQKLFCLLVTTDKQCFGNKSKSYEEAYELRTDKQKRNARFLGSRLYANDNIQRYIKKLLKSRFENDSIDLELSKVIVQDRDLISKRAAIADYNKMMNRLKETPTTTPIIIHIAPEIAAKIA